MEKENKELLLQTFRTAWPSALESLSVGCVSIADTIMVSALGSVAIAAVGMTSQPKMLALTPFTALQIAVSSLVARRKGEKDRESANRILRQAVAVALILGLFVGAVCVAFADAIYTFMGAEPESHELAVHYFYIIGGGILFQGLSMVINGAQRGAGNTGIALRTSLISNLVNLILNYLLIQGRFGFPALGVTGAAIATLFGTVCACLVSLSTILHKDGFLCWSCKGERKAKDILSLCSLGRLASSSWIEQLCMRFGIFLFTAVVAHMGTQAFAAHQIGMNILFLCFSFGDGLSAASVALVGQSLGAKDSGRALHYLKIIRGFAFAISAVLSVIFLLLGRPIYLSFSREEEIVNIGVIVLYFIAVIVFIQTQQVISSGCLRAAGDARYVAVVSFVSVTVIRPIFSYLLCYVLDLGLIGAWLAILTDQFTRMVCVGIRVKKGGWIRLQI